MKLLISIREPGEAVDAVRGGVDILDVKEPRRGSLGAPDLATVQRVVAACPDEIPLSIACGELRERRGFSLRDIPTSVRYAKFGLSGCANDPHWANELQDAWSQLPADTAPVAVAYADWKVCEAPPPEEIIDAATNRAQVFLIDTSSKCGSICQRFSVQQVSDWLARARVAGLRVAVAGSLTVEDIPHVGAWWSPDVIAFRGAACAGSRESTVRHQKVADIRTRVDDWRARSQLADPKASR